MQCEFVRALDLTAALVPLPSALVDDELIPPVGISPLPFPILAIFFHAMAVVTLLVLELLDHDDLIVDRLLSIDLMLLHMTAGVFNLSNPIRSHVSLSFEYAVGFVSGLETRQPHYRLHPPACSLRLLQS
jgi:hypothetical protein